MKKIIVLLLLLILMLSADVFADSNTNVNVVNVMVNTIVPIEQTGKPGRINWGQGAQGTIEAVGTGFPPANVQNPSQATALARRAAIVDAYRNLTETIYGVRVDAKTTMQNLALANDIALTRVSGTIENAKIVRESPKADGSYQVVMSVNIYGAGSVAETAVEATNPTQAQEFPQPVGAQSALPSLNYTGVIIDAREFGLEPTFSPQIYDASGRIIYGKMYINPDIVVSRGIVEYAVTSAMLDAAIKGGSRAGNRPLILKAVAVTDNNCGIVLSDADANMLLESNSAAGFLKNCAVVIAL